MKLDPRLQPVASAIAAPTDRTRPAAERRAEGEAFMAAVLPRLVTPGPELASVVDETTPGGVPVRIYRPREGRLPVLMYFHGGGFWEGSINSRDAGCRKRALAADCLVISVGYRLAPEHPFPAGLEDCWAATLWAIGDADRLGIDPARVVVSGESAGGNLAAVVAIRARDRNGPLLAGQLLEVPTVDAVGSYPSQAEFGETFGVSVEEFSAQIAGWYLAGADPASPEVSPVLADLRGLPATLVTTSECDWLRDEGKRFADLLAEAGVTVAYRNYEGTLHATADLDVLVPDIAERYLADVVGFLGSVFGGASPTG